MTFHEIEELKLKEGDRIRITFISKPKESIYGVIPKKPGHVMEMEFERLSIDFEESIPPALGNFNWIIWGAAKGEALDPKYAGRDISFGAHAHLLEKIEVVA